MVDEAFRWKDGVHDKVPFFTPSRYAFGRARAINNAGQIVGACNWMPGLGGGDTGLPTQEAAVLCEGDQIYDLNSQLTSKLELTLYEAVAINNKGQIVCLGQDRSGKVSSQVFLLTPKP